MNQALLQQIPDRILQVAIRHGLQKREDVSHKSVIHWSEKLSDSDIYKDLLTLYFPDENEAVTPILDKLSESQCESMLLHGISYRYGHLEGVQKSYLLSVLSEDYQNQEKLLKQNPSECLSTNYVVARAEDSDETEIEFRHISEIAASKHDAQALFLMLNAYKQLCEINKNEAYSGKFFEDNYNAVQQENAFLKEARTKLSFINLAGIQGELADMALLESFESLADIGDLDKLAEIKRKKQQAKERRKEIAKNLIKGIKAITQKKIPKNKQFSKREWPFVDFNEFYNHFMKNDLGNDNGPSSPSMK